MRKTCETSDRNCLAAPLKGGLKRVPAGFPVYGVSVWFEKLMNISVTSAVILQKSLLVIHS